MSKPNALAVAWRLAPSIKSAIRSDGNIGRGPLVQAAQGRGSVRFRLCLQAGRYSMLAEVTRQEAPATGAGGKRRCAGNLVKSILPRRINVKIRARHAQLY